LSEAAGAGALFLIPTLLGESGVDEVLPEAVKAKIQEMDAFVAESAKSARHFLRAAGYPRPLTDVVIRELNEHTPAAALEELLAPIDAGMRVGMLSEAGCPAVADPGAALIALAHARGLRVVPLVGPSALLLALMASGLNGQRFCFHGYLPVDRAERDDAIRQLETASRRGRQTQMFIEAPYRNVRMFDALLRVCHPATRLCLATHLTLADESVRTCTIAQWRGVPVPQLDRRPTVFLLLAY